MNFKEYNTQIKAWTLEYGPIAPSISRKVFNPSKVNNCCKKCGKEKKRMARHHKANDYFFAMILPHVYAKRYIQFLADDIDLLCERCHRTWHNYVKPKIKKMYDEWEQIKHLSIPNFKEHWAFKWKAKILQWYVIWIEQPLTKKKSVKIPKK